MTDTKYDAVIIGGGHHGTIMACYLAKTGMNVAVFEKHTNLGGGAISEEAPDPGFRKTLVPTSLVFMAILHIRISIYVMKD